MITKANDFGISGWTSTLSDNGQYVMAYQGRILDATEAIKLFDNQVEAQTAPSLTTLGTKFAENVKKINEEFNPAIQSSNELLGITLPDTIYNNTNPSLDALISKWDTIKMAADAAAAAQAAATSMTTGIGNINGGSNTSLPSYQFGGFVPSEGIYHLHAGERVVPNNYAGNWGNISVSVSTPSIASSMDTKALARQVSDVIMSKIQATTNPTTRWG